MVTNKIYFMHQFYFSSIKVLSECAQLQFKRKCTIFGFRLRKALNIYLIIILEICQKQPFDIIAMTSRGTLWLCCIRIAQLMTHPGVYTLPLTLQLCYKPLCILKRVTKSQKVHMSSHCVLQKLHKVKISSHNLLQNLHNISFA